jgi:hypothetical protein
MINYFKEYLVNDIGLMLMTEEEKIIDKYLNKKDKLIKDKIQLDSNSNNMDIVIDTIAKRYNTPREIVIKSISEWSAGDRKTKNEPEADN